MKLNVFIVDDHPIFRAGLAFLLSREEDFVMCGEAESSAEALLKASQLIPDLALIDSSLGTMRSGLDLTKSLRAGFPAMRIMVLSVQTEPLFADRALRAGANGYISKRENGQTLLSAIRHILSGKIYISNQLNEYFLERVSLKSRDAKISLLEILSDRELEVFTLIGQGYGTRQIADSLRIGIKTVEVHRIHIRAKLNLKSTFELVQNAMSWVFTSKKNPLAEATRDPLGCNCFPAPAKCPYCRATFPQLVKTPNAARLAPSLERSMS